MPLPALAKRRVTVDGMIAVHDGPQAARTAAAHVLAGLPDTAPSPDVGDDDDAVVLEWTDGATGVYAGATFAPDGKAVGIWAGTRQGETPGALETLVNEIVAPEQAAARLAPALDKIPTGITPDVARRRLDAADDTDARRAVARQILLFHLNDGLQGSAAAWRTIALGLADREDGETRRIGQLIYAELRRPDLVDPDRPERGAFAHGLFHGLTGR